MGRRKRTECNIVRARILDIRARHLITVGRKRRKMSDSFEKIGYSAHLEAFTVFLVLGGILGLIGGAFEALGGDPGEIFTVAEQGVALSVFMILCVGGLFGLLLADWQQLPRLIGLVLNRLCPSVLRVGLTTGFVAAGIIIGVGVGAFVPFYLLGTPEQQAPAQRLILLGALILLIWWPFYYAAAEVLDAGSKTIHIVAGLYVFMLAILLANVSTSSLWWGSGLPVLAAMAATIVVIRRVGKRRPNKTLEPTP